MMAHDPSLFAGGAALNALDEMEDEQFRRHLEDCPTCQLELAGFVETAARLGAASAETPPVSLRASVLAAVAVTRQLPPLTSRPGTDGQQPVVAAPAVETGGAEVIDLAARRRTRGRWLLSAAAAVALALVGLTFFLSNRTPGIPDQADALRQCVNTAADREQKPTAPGSTGDTTVIVSASCGGALLSFADVPALQAGTTYQLWVISGDQTRSVATLQPASDGTMPQTVAAVRVGDTALGVTVEPAGGSPAPTTTPVITVPLSA